MKDLRKRIHNLRVTVKNLERAYRLLRYEHKELQERSAKTAQCYMHFPTSPLVFPPYGDAYPEWPEKSTVSVPAGHYHFSVFEGRGERPC